jgi:Flp pilus assembly pilin Flp
VRVDRHREERRCEAVVTGKPLCSVLGNSKRGGRARSVLVASAHSCGRKCMTRRAKIRCSVRGQVLAEYALITALLALILFMGLSAMSNGVMGVFDRILSVF